MKVELIYSNENKCNNLESLLLKISGEPLLCFTKMSKSEFLEALETAFTTSELIVIVGGFYSGSFSLPKLFIEQYELPSAIHKTTRESHFNDEPQNSLVLPSNALPLYDDNGAIFGAVIESEQQKMILLSESLSEGKYSYLDELEAYLEKVNLIRNEVPQNNIIEPLELSKDFLDSSNAVAIAQTIIAEKESLSEKDSNFEIDFVELPEEKAEDLPLIQKKKPKLKGLVLILLLRAKALKY